MMIIFIDIICVINNTDTNVKWECQMNRSEDRRHNANDGIYDDYNEEKSSNN